MPKESKNNLIKPLDALLLENLVGVEMVEVVAAMKEVAEDSQESNKQVFQSPKLKE